MNPAGAAGALLPLSSAGIPPGNALIPNSLQIYWLRCPGFGHGWAGLQRAEDGTQTVPGATVPAFPSWEPPE